MVKVTEIVVSVSGWSFRSKSQGIKEWTSKKEDSVIECTGVGFETVVEFRVMFVGGETGGKETSRVNE